MPHPIHNSSRDNVIEGDGPEVVHGFREINLGDETNGGGINSRILVLKASFTTVNHYKKKGM